MRFKSFVVIAAALLSCSAADVGAADAQGEANVHLIKDFLKDTRAAMTSRDPAKVRAVAERYMDADYIQHSKGMAPGREGYIKGVSGPPPGGPPGAPPGGAVPSGPPPAGAPPSGPSGDAISFPKDLYFFANGEYVVWVSEGMEPGKLDFNMVRVVNGKMKEHWDSH